jgi:TPR repeat protein
MTSRKREEAANNRHDRAQKTARSGKAIGVRTTLPVAQINFCQQKLIAEWQQWYRGYTLHNLPYLGDFVRCVRPVAPSSSAEGKVRAYRVQMKTKKWLLSIAHSFVVFAVSLLLISVLPQYVCSEQLEDVAELTSLALSGHKEAQYEIGMRYFNGNGVAKNHGESLKWMLMAAHQGHVKAQTKVGWMYQNGKGTQRNGFEGERWYRIAAESGDPDAAYSMGMIHTNGWSVPINKAEGEKWFIRWGEQGGAYAKFNLGEMYVAGRMLPQDSVKAVFWYKQAAESGHKEAKKRLAVIRSAGNNVATGEAGWTQQLAESGDAESLYRTGVNYNQGNQRESIEQDYQKALHWYRQAADKGHPGAMGAIAVLYANGTGVNKSDDTANKWWRKAAAKGDDSSISFLTWRYRDGNGVPKDNYKAYLWCSLRGWQYGRGKSVDNECEAIASKLSSQQIIKAKKEATRIRSGFERWN